MAQTFKTIMNYPGLRKGEAEAVLEQALCIVEAILPDYMDKFPHSNSENGFYERTENVEWTTGFWTDVLWLAYE